MGQNLIIYNFFSKHIAKRLKLCYNIKGFFNETGSIMKNKRTIANVLLLLTSIIWGLAFVFQRVGMDKIEPLTFNAARMATGAICVFIVSIIADKRNKNIQKTEQTVKKTWLGGILCGLFLSAASAVQQIGLVYTTAGKAGFITAMYMLFVPILNTIIFKKKSGARVWIAVILGMVGMYLLCLKESFVLTEGDALVFLCALLFSGHILCCDKFAPDCDPIKLSAIQFAVAAVINTALAFIFESPTVEAVTSAAVPILYCGLLSGGVGYTLQIVGQKHTDPATASLIMSLESVFALIAGVLILQEKMTGLELLGCVIMFAAIMFIQLPTKKEE